MTSDQGPADQDVLSWPDGAFHPREGILLYLFTEYYLFMPCLDPRRLQQVNTKYSNAHNTSFCVV